MRDDRDERRPDGLFDALADFFEAIHRAAEEGQADEQGSLGDRVRVDFDYDVRTGLGPGAPGRKGHPRFDGTPEAGTADGRRAEGPDTDPGARPSHVAVEDDRRIVTVDVSDVAVTDASAVSVTVDAGDVGISHGGTTLATVPVSEGPWTVADVSLNNGVLAVEVVPA